MTNFTYTRDVPNPPNNPSVDVPKMKTNTNSADDIWDVDHYGFNDNLGGLHNKSSYTQRLVAPAIPAGAGGVMYGGANGGNTWPTWVNSLGNIALTIKVPSIGPSGYVSLPGGLYMQWGTDTKTSGGSVSFPLAFPTACFGVNCTVVENNNNRHFVFVKTVSTTAFTVASRDSGGNDESNTFFWIALGN